MSSFAGDSHRPVFVGGCPRSGTTLLRTMLNSHPDLAMPRETRFLLETWERRRAFGDLSDPANRRRLARSIFRRAESKAGRLGIPRRKAIAALTAAPPTIGSLLGACFAQYAERNNKIRWGDKRPIYVLHLDAIFAMFPNAQFINLIRDPRGVVASIHKLGWFGRDTIPAVDWWNRSLRAADTWRDRLRTDQFLDVQYEDLVGEPRATLRRICAFLSLDPAGIDTMLAFHESNDVTNKRYHWQLSQPVTTASLTKWKQTLSGEEIALVERAAAAYMYRYGYEPSAGQRITSASRWRALIAHRVQSRASLTSQAARETVRRIRYRYPVAALPLELETFSARP